MALVPFVGTARVRRIECFAPRLDRREVVALHGALLVGRHRWLLASEPEHLANLLPDLAGVLAAERIRGHVDLLELLRVAVPAVLRVTARAPLVEHRLGLLVGRGLRSE